MVLGACGGDDDGNADATATTSAADAHPTAFCEAFDDVNQALAGVENDRSEDPSTGGRHGQGRARTAPTKPRRRRSRMPSPTMTATGRDQIGGSADQDDHSGPPLPPAEFFTASAEVGAWVGGQLQVRRHASGRDGACVLGGARDSSRPARR